MSTTQDKVRYRIGVYISGASPQYFYACGEPQREKMTARSIKALTDNEPGFGGTTPKQCIVEKQVRVISGRKSQWEVVQTILYKDLPDDQLEWKQRKLRRCQGVVARIQGTVQGISAPDWDKMVRIKPCGSGSQYEMTGWIMSLTYQESKHPVQLEGLPPQMSSMEYINHDTNRRFKLFSGLIQSRVVGKALEPDFGFARIELRDREPVYKKGFRGMTLTSTPVQDIALTSTPVKPVKKLETQWTVEEQPPVVVHVPEAEGALKKALNDSGA